MDISVHFINLLILLMDTCVLWAEKLIFKRFIYELRDSEG